MHFQSLRHRSHVNCKYIHSTMITKNQNRARIPLKGINLVKCVALYLFHPINLGSLSINSQTFILITRRVALLEQTQDIKGYANTSRNYLITFTHEKFNCFFSIHPSRTSTSNDRIYLEQSTQKKERQADPQKLLQI